MSNNTKARICLAIGALLVAGVITCFVLVRLGIIPSQYQIIPFVTFIVGSVAYIACMIKVIDDMDDKDE